MAKKIKELDYLTISTRVHALETRMLTAERIERMLDARSFEEVVRIVTECGYPELKEMTVSGIEKMLAQALRSVKEDLRTMAPDPALVDLLFVPNDYHNAKVILKARAIGQEADRLLVDSGRYEPARLKEDILQGYTKNQSPIFAEAVNAAWDALSRGADPQAADMILDKACFAEMFHIAREAGSVFMEGYVKLLVDCINLRTLVRCRRMGRDDEFIRNALIPGGNIEKDRFLTISACTELPSCSDRFSEATAAGEAAMRGGPLTVFERRCDNALMEYLSQGKSLSFGERPLIGYLYAKQVELTNLRVILTGRLSGLDTETIRERLRDPYA